MIENLHLLNQASNHLKESIKVFHLPGVNGEIPPVESRTRWWAVLNVLTLINIGWFLEPKIIQLQHDSTGEGSRGRLYGKPEHQMRPFYTA